MVNLQLALVYDYTVQGSEHPLVNNTEGCYIALRPLDTLLFHELFYLTYGTTSDADTTQ